MRKLTCFLTVLTLMHPVSTLEAQGSKNKPNVIFILADDLGWTDLGCYGSDFYQTPNIDHLAEKGVRFTNAYSACTVCSPSRASILSGKYPANLNCTDYIPGKNYPYARLKVPDWTMYLDTAEVTLAEVFRANGYTTAHIGKWHLGNDTLFWPENHGFDINLGGWAKGAPIRRMKTGENGYFSPYGNPRLDDGPEGEYLTERLANEACAFIQQNKQQPFFLNLWFYAVHLPLQAEKNKIEKYEALKTNDNKHQNATYAAMIEHLDDAVGRIIIQLKELNLLENTILVFTSDNGGLIGNAAHHKEPITSNYPLRSGKGDMYEGGVRVPCIISYPGKIQAPGVSELPLCGPDFMPTLMELAKIEDNGIVEWDGISLAQHLMYHKEISDRPLFWHYPHYHNEGAVPYSAVRLGDYKLIHNIEADSYQLYNLAEDIGEKQNLFSDSPLKAKELIVLLEEWKKKVGAQMPSSNPDFIPAKAKVWERASSHSK